MVSTRANPRPNPVFFLPFCDVQAHYGKSGASFRIPCPAHGAEKDENCVLSEGEGGDTVAFCHSHEECTNAAIKDGIRRAMGLPELAKVRANGKALVPPERAWKYQTPGGVVEHVRREKPEGGKDFLWRHIADGKTVWKLPPSVKTKELLYVVGDAAAAEAVLVEGEKNRRRRSGTLRHT